MNTQAKGLASSTMQKNLEPVAYEQEPQLIAMMTHPMGLDVDSISSFILCYAIIECYGESANLRRLAIAFAAGQCDK